VTVLVDVCVEIAVDAIQIEFRLTTAPSPRGYVCRQVHKLSYSACGDIFPTARSGPSVILIGTDTLVP